MRNPCDICEAFDERFGRVAPEVIALSHEEQLLFSAVDALLEQIAQDPLPPPAERKRLREAAGLSQDQVAKALGSRRESVGNWESGRSEPRPPKRAAYARLLEGLAARCAPEPVAEAVEPVEPRRCGGRRPCRPRACALRRARPATPYDREHRDC